jgi:hypothetical protein
LAFDEAGEHKAKGKWSDLALAHGLEIGPGTRAKAIVKSEVAFNQALATKRPGRIAVGR